MNLHDVSAVSQLDIVTVLSFSEKSKVSLVSEKDCRQLAILKEYDKLDLQNFYIRIQEIKSPYLPKIYKVWEEQGHTYLLEEYIAGKTLREYLNEGLQLKQAQIQSYIEDLCCALETLHKVDPPIIHRDIKPENILITKNGNLKLLDFDAAREYKETQERDTVLLGTREYASPEQFGFMQTDARSDIYSVGVVFAELLDHAQVTSDYRKRAGRIISLATMFDPEKRYDRIGSLLKDVQRLNKFYHKKYIPLIGMSILFVTGLLILGICIAMSRRPVVPDVEVIMQEQSEEMDESELATESVSSETDSTLSGAVPLEEAYTYRSIEEEIRTKCDYLMNERSDLYRIDEDPYEDEGRYRSDQECIIGRDYPTLRFQLACPRDLVISDECLEGYTLESIYLEPYIQESGTNGERRVLDASDYNRRFENVIAISQEYLQTLEPGVYTIHIKTEKPEGSRTYSFYLIVNSQEETVYNCRLYACSEIAYYSSVSCNDVFFYINNTPYPIESVKINGNPADEGDYQLVEEGYGVVFSSDVLKQYEGAECMELTFVAENGKYTGGRIIFLQHFEE